MGKANLFSTLLHHGAAVPVFQVHSQAVHGLFTGFSRSFHVVFTLRLVEAILLRVFEMAKLSGPCQRSEHSKPLVKPGRLQDQVKRGRGSPGQIAGTV